MRSNVFFVTFGLFAASLSTHAVGANKSCYDKAITQYDINTCSGNEYQLADKELNIAYQELLQKYRPDEHHESIASKARHISKIREAQRMWLKWRDAEVEAFYPSDEIGSVRSMCLGMKLTEITKERVKQIRAWIKGGQEGDVCSP